MGVFSKIKTRWNAFFSRDPTEETTFYAPVSSSSRPDRVILTPYNGRSIMTPVITRIANDVASMPIMHAKVDDDDHYKETIKDGLHKLLTYRANIDQTGEELIRDAVTTMCDEGVVAIVPYICEGDPRYDTEFTVEQAKVAKIIEWMPEHVRVDVYNPTTMKHEQKVFEKRFTCIIENPFYSIMNAPNSTLQQYVKKSSTLDRLESRNGAGKLDIIVQLPYSLKTEQKRSYAEQRKKDIESQLIDSPYGIAYIDAMERVTQLNRPAENTLLEQIDKLKEEIRNQLGMTESVFNGTATEEEMINYENRTTKVIMRAIANEMTCKWISLEKYDEGERVMTVLSPFRHLTVTQIADSSDKLTRNEILSSNEVRAAIGYKPSDNPDADALRNKNLNKSDEEINPKRGININKEMSQNGSE